MAVLLWGPQLRFRTRPERGARTGALALRKSALAWQVTLFMGLQSLSYYGTLSWFATMFRDRGASAAYAGTLLALMNVGNADHGDGRPRAGAPRTRTSGCWPWPRCW